MGNLIPWNLCVADFIIHADLMRNNVISLMKSVGGIKDTIFRTRARRNDPSKDDHIDV